MVNKWYVITGGPCSGKTTVINELEKLGYRIVRESAREYIDGEITKGRTITDIRADQEVFQRETLRMKVEKEKALSKDEIIFFDRGIPDTRAYYKIHNIAEGDEAQKHIENSSYKQIFFFDTLPILNDYGRTETSEEQQAIHAAIERAYMDLGMPLVHVPVLRIEERVAFVVALMNNN